MQSPTLARAAEKLGDDPALPFMLASGAIMQAYRVMSIQVSAVLETVEDLSMPRYEVLGLLALSDDGRLAVRDIKRASLLHPPTLTYILDWLEKQGHVTRKPDAIDRRSVLIQLTAKGRRTFQRAQDALREIQFGLPGMDPEEALAVARALDLTGGQ